ncbi:hypothetical protein IDH44_12935, partial [Paenibacillus sp. IB182496]
MRVMRLSRPDAGRTAQAGRRAATNAAFAGRIRDKYRSERRQDRGYRALAYRKDAPGQANAAPAAVQQIVYQLQLKLQLLTNLQLNLPSQTSPAQAGPASAERIARLTTLQREVRQLRLQLEQSRAQAGPDATQSFARPSASQMLPSLAGMPMPTLRHPAAQREREERLIRSAQRSVETADRATGHAAQPDDAQQSQKSPGRGRSDTRSHQARSEAAGQAAALPQAEGASSRRQAQGQKSDGQQRRTTAAANANPTAGAGKTGPANSQSTAQPNAPAPAQARPTSRRGATGPADARPKSQSAGASLDAAQPAARHGKAYSAQQPAPREPWITSASALSLYGRPTARIDAGQASTILGAWGLAPVRPLQLLQRRSTLLLSALGEKGSFGWLPPRPVTRSAPALGPATAADLVNDKSSVRAPGIRLPQAIALKHPRLAERLPLAWRQMPDRLWETGGVQATRPNTKASPGSADSGAAALHLADETESARRSARGDMNVDSDQALSVGQAAIGRSASSRPGAASSARSDGAAHDGNRPLADSYMVGGVRLPGRPMMPAGGTLSSSLYGKEGQSRANSARAELVQRVAIRPAATRTPVRPSFPAGVAGALVRGSSLRSLLQRAQRAAPSAALRPAPASQLRLRLRDASEPARVGRPPDGLASEGRPLPARRAADDAAVLYRAPVSSRALVPRTAAIPIPMQPLRTRHSQAVRAGAGARAAALAPAARAAPPGPVAAAALAMPSPSSAGSSSRATAGGSSYRPISDSARWQARPSNGVQVQLLPVQRTARTGAPIAHREAPTEVRWQGGAPAGARAAAIASIAGGVSQRMLISSTLRLRLAQGEELRSDGRTGTTLVPRAMAQGVPVWSPARRRAEPRIDAGARTSAREPVLSIQKRSVQSPVWPLSPGPAGVRRATPDSLAHADLAVQPIQSVAAPARLQPVARLGSPASAGSRERQEGTAGLRSPPARAGAPMSSAEAKPVPRELALSRPASPGRRVGDASPATTAVRRMLPTALTSAAARPSLVQRARTHAEQARSQQQAHHPRLAAGASLARQRQARPIAGASPGQQLPAETIRGARSAQRAPAEWNEGASPRLQGSTGSIREAPTLRLAAHPAMPQLPVPQLPVRQDAAPVAQPPAAAGAAAATRPARDVRQHADGRTIRAAALASRSPRAVEAQPWTAPGASSDPVRRPGTLLPSLTQARSPHRSGTPLGARPAAAAGRAVPTGPAVAAGQQPPTVGMPRRTSAAAGQSSVESKPAFAQRTAAQRMLARQPSMLHSTATMKETAGAARFGAGGHAGPARAQADRVAPSVQTTQAATPAAPEAVPVAAAGGHHSLTLQARRRSERASLHAAPVLHRQLASLPRPVERGEAPGGPPARPAPTVSLQHQQRRAARAQPAPPP